MTNREAVYKVLMVIANRQGFILSPDIEDACIETELSLIDTDWVSSRIVQQNIPVLDEVPEKKHNIKKIEKSTPDRREKGWAPFLQDARGGCTIEK